MRFIFFSIFLSSAFFVNAQTKPFEQKLGWPGGGSGNPIYVKSIADSSKTNTMVIVKNLKQLKGFLFGKEMNFVKEISTTGFHEKILGGFIKDQHAHVFLRADYSSIIHTYDLDLATGAASDNSIQLELKGEKELGKLNAGNSFIYITAAKKEPVINVYKFTGGEAIEKISYDLGIEALKTGLEKRNLWEMLTSTSGLSRNVDIALVDPDIEAAPEVVDAQNKIYLKNDSLILLIDRAPEQLKIFSLDLNSKQATYRTLERDFPPIIPDAFDLRKFNSFLLEDKLYFVHATPNDFNVSIYNFYTSKLLSTYTATGNDSINFKNTPVIQEGGGTFFSQDIDRKLVKTKQLLRKFSAGNALICAIRNDSGQHEVTVGAYKKITQSSGGYVPMGGAGMTMRFTPYSSYSWSRVTRFKMLIDPNTGKHIEGQMIPSVSDQIENYSKDLKIPEEGSSLFVANNFHQFAYYDRTEKKLVVIKF